MSDKASAQRGRVESLEVNETLEAIKTQVLAAIKRLAASLRPKLTQPERFIPDVITLENANQVFSESALKRIRQECASAQVICDKLAVFCDMADALTRHLTEPTKSIEACQQILERNQAVLSKERGGLLRKLFNRILGKRPASQRIGEQILKDITPPRSPRSEASR